MNRGMPFPSEHLRGVGEETGYMLSGLKGATDTSIRTKWLFFNWAVREYQVVRGVGLSAVGARWKDKHSL